MTARAKRYVTSIVPVLEKADIEERERFRSADLQKDLEMNAAHIGQTLTYLADNYDVPIEYEEIDPRKYFVTDFERLQDSKQEIWEEVKEKDDISEELTLELVKQELEGETERSLDETDLQSYLIKKVEEYEGIGDFSRKVQRANEILEELEGDIILQYDEEQELEKTYTVSR